MRLIILTILAAASLLADDTITALGRQWSVPIAADWKITKDGADEVLQLTVPRPQEKPRRPKQFATLLEGPFSEFTLEVDVKRNEKSIVLVYAYQDDGHFNYAHLSVDDPAKQPVHNGIFHVYGGDRVRISPTTGGPGALPDTNWTRVKLTWSGKTGELIAYANGKTTAALRGIDLSLTEGKIGLGSFFETAQFKNLKLKAVPAK